MTKYFKVTNLSENHNGHQYRDGLNELSGEFNYDPEESCVAGGFYFTTSEHIDKFIITGYGCEKLVYQFRTPSFV